MEGRPHALAIQDPMFLNLRVDRVSTHVTHQGATMWRRGRTGGWRLSVTLPRRRVHSPLVSKKEEVSDGDHDCLEQDQPAHKPPFGLGLGVLHSPKQRRLRQQKARDQFPRILPAKVFLKHDLFDRVFSIALGERFQCFLGKSVLKSFFAHSEGSVPETTGVRLPDFDGA